MRIRSVVKKFSTILLEKGLFYVLAVFCLLDAASAVCDDPAIFTAEIDDAGKIAVVDESDGSAVHVIEKPAGVVRELHALAAGTIVAVSQKDFTDFIDTENGKQIRRYERRIYAFSHGENLCAALFTVETEHKLIILTYPELSQKFILEPGASAGPAELVFSPNDLYLAVQFSNAYPLSDEMYIDPVLDGILYWVCVFDLENGQKIPEIGGAYLGSFTEDSHHYQEDSGRIYDLVKREWTQPRSR